MSQWFHGAECLEYLCQGPWTLSTVYKREELDHFTHHWWQINLNPSLYMKRSELFSMSKPATETDSPTVFSVCHKRHGKEQKRRQIYLEASQLCRQPRHSLGVPSRSNYGTWSCLRAISMLAPFPYNMDLSRFEQQCTPTTSDRQVFLHCNQHKLAL